MMRRRATSKGTITVYRTTITLRKVVGVMEVWDLANKSNKITGDFESVLEDALYDSSELELGLLDIKEGPVTVQAYRSGPGIEVSYRVSKATPEQVWEAAKLLGKKGYSVK